MPESNRRFRVQGIIAATGQTSLHDPTYLKPGGRYGSFLYLGSCSVVHLNPKQSRSNRNHDDIPLYPYLMPLESSYNPCIILISSIAPLYRKYTIPTYSPHNPHMIPTESLYHPYRTLGREPMFASPKP